MMERKIGKVDLISSLPEPILQHIMSFLPFEEVVQTSILSKRWKQAWDTYPTLEFTDVCYNISRKKETLKYMEQTLLKRLREKISMKKLSFRMELSNFPELASFIDRSLCYAIGCNVKELKLEIVYWGSVWWYNLPQSVLRASSITGLDLEGCKLELVGSSVRSPSLKKLLLKQVKVEDGVIDNLVARCPVIEYLTIDECEGLKRLELFSDNRVDKIKVRNNCELERVDINIVNVNWIAIYGQTTCEINVTPCKSLKCLELDMVSMPDELFSNQISELPLLEHLSITYCHELKIIKVSNPSLQKLLIFRCANLVEVRIETPNLSTFKYVGNIISVSSNALTLSETDLYVYSKSMDTDWFTAYNELLAKFHQFSKVLNLQSFTGENVIVPTEARQILLPPLSGIKHLKFTIHGEDADICIAETEEDADISIAEPVEDAEISIAEPEEDADICIAEPEEDEDICIAEPEEVADISIAEPEEDAEISIAEIEEDADISISEPEEDADISIAEIVDGLLWISSHLETLSLEYRNHYCDKFSFQFSYKNEITYEGGSPRCCQALPVLCWKDCIKKIEIEHIIRKKHRNEVKRYSFENEEIWEKINHLRRYRS